MQKEVSFCCPSCRKIVTVSHDRFECACGAIWPVREGIPVFFKDAPPYWCELPVEKAERLNRLAQERGWRPALDEIFAKKNIDFILDEARVNWKFLVPGDSAGVILDVGSGWGTLAFGLARGARQVYALESTWQRVKFIDIRARQEAVDNVIPVCADALSLPFADNMFDVVVLNGVVEWLGCSDTSVTADVVQERVLRDVLRVLKPGGCVYIGIENRLAYFYFFGRKDPHSKLRFATLLPRSLAHLYSRLIRKRPYDTYIYSIPGYRRLLCRAGFDRIEFFAPVPGYLNFRYLVSLMRPTALSRWLETEGMQRAVFMGKAWHLLAIICAVLLRSPLGRLARYFVPDYAIFARKPGGASSVCQLETLQTSRNGVIVAIRNPAGSGTSIARYVTDAAATQRLRAAVELIKPLISNLSWIVIPHKIEDTASGLMTVEAAAGRLPMSVYLAEIAGSTMRLRRLFGKITDAAVALYRSTAMETLDAGLISGKIVRRLTDKKYVVTEDVLWMIEQSAAAAGKGIGRRCYRHGDFSPWNMRVDRQGNFSVIDWEYASVDGLPLVDLLNFFFEAASIVRAVQAGGGSVTRRLPRAGVTDFHVAFSSGPCQSMIDDCLRQYCEQCEIGSEGKKLLVYAFAAQHAFHDKALLDELFHSGKGR